MGRDRPLTAPLALVPPVAERIWTIPELLTPDSPWRLEFGWSWGDGPRGLFVGVNPSMGTNAKPDATMLTMRGFAAAWGWGSLVIGNLCARRARNPKDLLRSVNVNAYAVGPDADDYLTMQAEISDVIVCCWGAIPRELYERAARVRILLEKTGRPLKCLGRTSAGHPKHPLYLPRRTPLEDFS
jgi:hypothetical protein